jgi:hypothetical protein
MYCLDRKILLSADDLWNHALQKHRDKIPTDELEKEKFRKEYMDTSAQKR